MTLVYMGDCSLEQLELSDFDLGRMLMLMVVITQMMEASCSILQTFPELGSYMAKGLNTIIIMRLVLNSCILTIS